MIYNKAEEIILHLKNKIVNDYLNPNEKLLSKKKIPEEEKLKIAEKVKYYQNLIFAIDVLTYTNKKDNKGWILINRLGFTKEDNLFFKKYDNDKKIIYVSTKDKTITIKDLEIHHEFTIKKEEFRDFIEIMRIM